MRKFRRFLEKNYQDFGEMPLAKMWEIIDRDQRRRNRGAQGVL